MKSFRLLLFGLAICVLGALGWRLAALPPQMAETQPERPPPPQPPTAPPTTPKPNDAPVVKLAEAREKVERRISEAQPYVGFFDALAAAFPHLRENLVDQWAARLIRDGALPSPDSLVWQASRDLQQTQGLLAKRASNEALANYFDARLALVDVMGPAEAKLCADFLYGTTDSSLETFSASHRDVVAEFARRQLAALKSGQDARQDPVPPTSADLDLIVSGLKDRGLNPDEIGMLLDGRSLDPPPSDLRLCDMGRTYLAVLRSLPTESRNRIYGLAAELLARS